MEQNITSLNQVRIHLNNSTKKANSQNVLHTFISKKSPMLICSSLPYSDSENKLPNCKRKNQMYLKDK